MATGIKLDEQTRERLISLGDRMERSPHWIMKKAIESYLNEQERYWNEREEDMKRWEEYALTGESVPHDTVMEWLDTVGTENEAPCPA